MHWCDPPSQAVLSLLCQLAYVCRAAALSESADADNTDTALIVDTAIRSETTAEQQKIDETAGPIYVSYKEVKGAPVHTARHNKKTAYIKHFYLIDVHGKEVLAACGEDQGISHTLNGPRKPNHKFERGIADAIDPKLLIFLERRHDLKTQWISSLVKLYRTQERFR